MEKEAIPEQEKARSPEKATTAEPAKKSESKSKHKGWEIFNHVILFFVIGCIFGTVWEEVGNLLRHLIDTGEILWVSRRGLLYGPFSPVYGIGAVLIYLTFYLKKAKPLVCFFGGALAGGVLEASLSWLQEMIFGTVSWDYSDRPLSLVGGRTSVFYICVWGFLITLFVYVVFPAMDKLYQKIPEKILNYTCVILAVVMACDIGISVVASARQAARRAGNPPHNQIEQVLDDIYTDERMKKTYDNARYVRNQ